MTPRILADQSDTELKARVENLREQADQYRNVAQSKDELADDIESILKRRVIAAYWSAHPGLLQVEIGDKLLVTEATIREIHGNPDKYYIGAEIEVCDIWVDRNLVYVQNPQAKGFTAMIAPEYAAEMRRAYLRDNPPVSPSLPDSE